MVQTEGYQRRSSEPEIWNSIKVYYKSHYYTALVSKRGENILVNVNLMNAVKTKQTNSLKAETVKCKLLSKQLIQRGNNTCATWQPSKRLLKDIGGGAVSQRYKLYLLTIKT